MRSLWCGVSLLACVLRVSPLSVPRDDPLDLMKEVLRNTREGVLAHGWRTFPAPDVRYGFVLGGARLDGGRLGDVASVVLRGEEGQRITQQDSEWKSVFSFDVVLGLDRLEARYNLSYSLLYLLGGEAGLVVSGSGEDEVRVRGQVVVGKAGGCSATIQNAEVLRLGSLRMAFSHSSGLFSFLLPAFLRGLAPSLLSQANRHLAILVKELLPTSPLSTILCHSFIVPPPLIQQQRNYITV